MPIDAKKEATNMPTGEEQKAISALKQLAKRWPKSLWLYSANGTLWVMKCGKDGERVEEANGGSGPGFDQAYAITSISIPNDGGDW